MKNKIAVLVFAALACAGNLSAADFTLWYQQPAANNQPMNEALPIGNGRMGALVFGQPARERISMNETAFGRAAKTRRATTTRWARIRCWAMCS